MKKKHRKAIKKAFMEGYSYGSFGNTWTREEAWEYSSSKAKSKEKFEQLKAQISISEAPPPGTGDYDYVTTVKRYWEL